MPSKKKTTSSSSDSLPSAKNSKTKTPARSKGSQVGDKKDKEKGTDAESKCSHSSCKPECTHVSTYQKIANKVCPTVDEPVKNATCQETKQTVQKTHCKGNPIRLVKKTFRNIFPDKNRCKLTKAEKKMWKKMRNGPIGRDETFKNLDHVRCTHLRITKLGNEDGAGSSKGKKDPKKGDNSGDRKASKGNGNKEKEGGCPIAAKREMIKTYMAKMECKDCCQKSTPKGFVRRNILVILKFVKSVYVVLIIQIYFTYDLPKQQNRKEYRMISK